MEFYRQYIKSMILLYPIHSLHYTCLYTCGLIQHITNTEYTYIYDIYIIIQCTHLKWLVVTLLHGQLSILSE